MSKQISLLQEVQAAFPHLRPQTYFKSSLTALSHAIEDQVLAETTGSAPLVIACFQQERFYRQEASRYLRIAELTDQVYIMAAPETNFAASSDHYETVPFTPDDSLAQEWHLIVVSDQYTICLICREVTHESDQNDPSSPGNGNSPPLLGQTLDQARRFEGIWSFDRRVSCEAARLLLGRVLTHRPALKPKITAAQARLASAVELTGFSNVDPAPFAERLMTHLQAGQYKLLKAYRSIQDQERRERLVNRITSVIRRSLDTDEILAVAVQELGEALQADRCLLYRCKNTDVSAYIRHQFCREGIVPVQSDRWPLQRNPLLREASSRQEPSHTVDAFHDPRLAQILPLVESAQIRSWLAVPVHYQGRLLGLIELHDCDESAPYLWTEEDIELVSSIATQVGVALIQAESYANLDDLNRQLEALDRTRSNLIAIIGHELRTPLSTIQVCLESLASEPDMVSAMRQELLNAALTDADRMRKLIQDFLTLSRLESGRVNWHMEPLSLSECVDLALSSIRSRREDRLPRISSKVSDDLPLVRADGEWLVEVLSKLLDNACKFTDGDGEVHLEAQASGSRMLEVTVSDTGRGIEPDRLEVIFDRFYQEEGALRRTAGGTGLGLAICRQIVQGLGGCIWAESSGRNQGSAFHFTLPTADGSDLPTNGSTPQPPMRATLR
ncbi:DICT sensory domain-containing protein [Leptolyngbya sp. FACHB-261]|uniref:DICT sensory domain-containing protein n=1 Tax=Leptolyngbya sp. FACHB-261 TaxID=2692806 RepID=UPI001683DF04|nr:DICT sensory domain-containing protein [Leptolyngbya sp. FACHB-261]MBD2104984.1 GAF domain-containing protein [Leptolyngbya sp. FACHB-261]